MNRRQFIAGSVGLAVGTRLPLQAALAAPTIYETVFYKSGNLNIEAYLYRPEGPGPFPLIVYNHGSRAGQERAEVPFAFAGEFLKSAGYAVLVSERRGYGKSGGEVAKGDLVKELETETDDVVAAVDYAGTLDYVDRSRLGIMGWSLGGIVTLFAISRANNSFRVAIDQAGGALSWKHDPALRKALKSAAALVKIPVFFMDSENDATTEAITSVSSAMDKTGVAHKLKIYPAFTPGQNLSDVAPGHLIFGREGVHIWRDDAVAFLDAVLAHGH